MNLLSADSQCVDEGEMDADYINYNSGLTIQAIDSFIFNSTVTSLIRKSPERQNGCYRLGIEQVNAIQHKLLMKEEFCDVASDCR